MAPTLTAPAPPSECSDRDIRWREIFRRVSDYLDLKHGPARRPSARSRERKARQTTDYVCFVEANGNWLRPPTLAETSKALGICERTLKERRALAAEVLTAGQGWL